LLIKDQQLLQNCLVRKIQRSPRPGLKQKASQNSGEAKLSSQFIWPSFKSFCQPEAIAILMESKLSDAQGQYFFWEPVNNDIPETGLSQP
jgi:hypothetical protein